MGLNASLITLVPSTNAKAEDVNTNLAALNNASVIGFIIGQITRQSSFTASASAAYSHGLGAVPDAVLITNEDGFSAQTYNYNHLTMTSSTVVINTSAGNNVIVVCLKFT